MKISEFKTKKSKKQVNELKLSSFLGNYGDALAKQTFGKASGLSKQDIMASNIFSNKFVSNALSSLDNAIKGGIVSMPQPATKPDRLQVPPGANPAPAAKPATPAKPAAPAAKPATPTQPRQTVAQKAQTQLQKQQAMRQKGKMPVKKPMREEEIYDRLNFIFESIIQEQDVYTIKDYLKTIWYPQFMKGVDYQPNQANIDQLLQQVEDTYAKDRGRAALTKLAQLSFAISPRKSQKDKDKQASGAPSTQAANAPNTAAQAQPIKITFGNVQYTKGPKGWVDPNNKLVDMNTGKILDLALAQDQGNPAPAANQQKP